MLRQLDPSNEGRTSRSASLLVIGRRALMVGASMLALILAAHLPVSAEVAPAAQQTAPAVPSGTPDFASLAEKVKPAVVSIKVKLDESASREIADEEPLGAPPLDGDNPFEGTPFEQFFNKFGQAPDSPSPGDSNTPPKALAWAAGSGFFISPDGYAVTNNHVVHGALKVEVTMDDGKVFAARVIGTDAKTDLALIKVDGKSNLPFVKMAAVKPRVGDWVMAVGNPFGLGGTVTSGIVSAEGRDIGAGPYDDYIQIDAPINKGNSGGPTFDLAGDVVGVNTAIYSPSGGSVGIAFDIPSTTVNGVISVLKDKGHIDRAWLGAEIQDVTSDIADSVGLRQSKGALVSEPVAGGPGDTAGLRSGDIITELDGVPIADSRELVRRIGGMPPNSKVALSTWRDGREHKIKLTLGLMKDEPSKIAVETANSGADLGALGLSVAPAKQVAGAGVQGLVVTTVDPNGAGASAGIESGDVILNIGGAKLSSAKDAAVALAEASRAGKKHALALVQHGKDRRYVPLPATT